MPPPNYNDEMNIPGAFRDFGQILVTPNRFFREQVGRNGLMSPILIIGIYLLLDIVCILINNGVAGVASFVMGLVFSPISIAITGAWMIFGYLISALFVHFIGWLFGNRQDYSVSFRACVFADAPRALIGVFVSLYWALAVIPAMTANPISPKEIEQTLGLPAGSMSGTYRSSGTSFPTASTPSTRPARGAPSVTRATPSMSQPSIAMAQRAFGLAWRRFGAAWALGVGLGVLAWAWSTVLLIMAIHRLQQISLGAAIGVVAVMYAIGLLIVGLIILGFAGLIFAFVNAVVHSGAAAGGGAGH
jgi:hypothetical protein